MKLKTVIETVAAPVSAPTRPLCEPSSSVSFRLTDTDTERLYALCARRECSRSFLIRQLLREESARVSTAG